MKTRMLVALGLFVLGTTVAFCGAIAGGVASLPLALFGQAGLLGGLFVATGG